MNMSIDNRYCNRFIHIGRPIFSVNRSGASVYNPDGIWERACPVLHSRGTVHPICDPSRIIATRQLNALTVPWSHIIIVFTSIPICFAGTNSIAIDLITVKDRFFFSASATSPGPPATIQPPFLLVVIRWLRNDFSIPRAPENMSHENIHSNLFVHLDII